GGGGGRAGKPAPGAGPGNPASQAPRPTPGSSEITSISPGPPTGLGPDSATTQARVPVRSSPAPANPVTSQPAGSGQGSQAGTMTRRSRPRRPSAGGGGGDRNGDTSPCRAQRQPLAQGLGSARGPPQRGQMGAVFMDIDGDRCRPARQAPRVRALSAGPFRVILGPCLSSGSPASAPSSSPAGGFSSSGAGTSPRW